MEAWISPVGTAFGAPFASLATGTWTTAADRVRVGGTNGARVSILLDDLLLDGSTMAQRAAALTLSARRRCPDQRPGRIRTRTTTPDSAVIAATSQIAARNPAASATIPASSAPTAKPPSRQSR